MFRNQYPFAFSVLASIDDAADAASWLASVEEDAQLAGACSQEAGRLAAAEVLAAVSEYLADRSMFEHLDPVGSELMAGYHLLKDAAARRYSPAPATPPAATSWRRVLARLGCR